MLGASASMLSASAGAEPRASMYVSMHGSLVDYRVAWPEIARLAAKIGYAGIEVNLSRAMRDGAERTLSLLRELRLKPSAMVFRLPIQTDQTTFRTTLVKLDEAVRFAAEIGCPRLFDWVSASTQTPKQELLPIFKERVKACAEVAARSNVRFGLEFLGAPDLRKRAPHEFIWRMDEMLDVAKQCGPNVGLVLDAFQWHHAGATTADIIAAGRQRIVHVHVSDSPDLPPEKILDSERLMPGEGIIDLVGFFQALKKIGYEDGVSPEPNSPKLKQVTPEEGARMGLESTLRVMRRAGVA